jgi:hypothetical protein
MDSTNAYLHIEVVHELLVILDVFSLVLARWKTASLPRNNESISLQSH